MNKFSFPDFLAGEYAKDVNNPKPVKYNATALSVNHEIDGETSVNKSENISKRVTFKTDAPDNNENRSRRHEVSGYTKTSRHRQKDITEIYGQPSVIRYYTNGHTDGGEKGTKHASKHHKKNTGSGKVKHSKHSQTDNHKSGHSSSNGKSDEPGISQYARKGFPVMGPKHAKPKHPLNGVVDKHKSVDKGVSTLSCDAGPDLKPTLVVRTFKTVRFRVILYFYHLRTY